MRSYRCANATAASTGRASGCYAALVKPISVHLDVGASIDQLAAFLESVVSRYYAHADVGETTLREVATALVALE